MISEHQEIEAKLVADGVTVKDFQKFALEYDVVGYKHVIGPDIYLSDGINAVRHRIHPDGKNELTVKKRLNNNSTLNRVEIDLRFNNKKTTPEDVNCFLKYIGFSPLFTVIKDAHIFWIKISPKLCVSMVIYDVWLTKVDPFSAEFKDFSFLRNIKKVNPKRFAEIEAEKGSDISVKTAKKQVARLVKALRKRFNLEGPVNQSLYEIFSDKRYQIVKG